MEYFDPNKPTPMGQSPQSYYDLMLGLSDLGAKERGIKQQMALAEQVRGGAAPQMRGNGRVMVAASPMEHMASAVRTGLGTYGTLQGMQQQQGLAQEIRRRIMEERARQAGGMGPVQMGPAGTPDSAGTPDLNVV